MLKKMKIGITGINGRMGKLLAEELIKSSALELNGALAGEHNVGLNEDIGTFVGLKKIGITITNSIEKLFDDCDGVIDFSAPDIGIKCAETASRKAKKFVTGTTGYSDEQLNAIKKFSEKCVIVQSGNMSIGINLLLNMIENSAKLLGDSYDAEVLEMHHRNKKDAPSGTALMLGRSIAQGRQVDFQNVAKKNRDGIIGVRERGEIGFATLRGGSVIGEHTVIFAGDDEVIEFSHRASSRQIFVNGALRAALWANTQKNGLYSMRDVLR
jgi:4-hydroxy-tetrahydrodipicolinate reductase